jgi:predicted nucleic acid-binding protein
MRVLVDTNVLLRAAEPTHVHHARAVTAIRSLRIAGDALCLVPQVHYEFWVVATRPVVSNGLGMTADEAEQSLAQFRPPLYRFHRDERAIYDAWRELVFTHSVIGKQGHDARLVAAMQRHGITHLLTFNVSDFTRFGEISVIEPK